MPANPKYLSSSGWQRFGKISAGFVGGYFVAMSFHLAIASWVSHVTVIITMTYTAFLLWAVLFALAFLARSVGRIWGLYTILILVFSAIAYFGRSFNPNFVL